MPTYPIPTPIYHFTHIDNLSDLIEKRAFLCKNEMLNERIAHTSSAYATIQGQRHCCAVPVSPGGTLHDYVPFYFTSLSPMLFTIKKGNIEGISHEKLVFFQSTAQSVEASGKKFAFTDGHGIMALSDFYNDLEDLDQIPWNVIKARYWNDFPDGGRLRQSEFLVYKRFDWELVETLGVFDSNMKIKVRDMIRNLSYRPKVKIMRSWYF